MNQDIIVFAIIALTIAYMVFGFVKNLRTKQVKSACGGCTGCELSGSKSKGCHQVEKINRQVIL